MYMRHIGFIVLVQVVTLLVIGSIGYLYLAGNPGVVREWIGEESVPPIQSIEDVYLSSEIPDLVTEALPAVVSVVAYREVPQYEPIPGSYNLFGIPELRELGLREQEVGTGSGFFVSGDGYIVTNRHVVADEEASYRVVTNDGEVLDAKVVARDVVYDVALLKVVTTNRSHLLFADEEIVRVGEPVIAIGNALGEFSNSVSLGIISGLSRSITADAPGGRPEQLDEVIQTDAAINPGNSGGPLISLSGRVVGVNVAVASGSENIAFALPATLVAPIVESVRSEGKIIRPQLGVRYLDLNPIIADELGVSAEEGALIIAGPEGEPGVIPGSAADRAGLREGDVILSLNDQKVNTSRSLASVVRRFSPEQQVTLTVERDGNIFEVDVVLDQAEDEG